MSEHRACEFCGKPLRYCPENMQVQALLFFTLGLFAGMLTQYLVSR